MPARREPPGRPRGIVLDISSLAQVDADVLGLTAALHHQVDLAGLAQIPQELQGLRGIVQLYAIDRGNQVAGAQTGRGKRAAIASRIDAVTLELAGDVGQL